MKLQDIKNPILRAQIEAKLVGQKPTKTEAKLKTKKTTRQTTPKEPNKTEARFNREVLGGAGMYEAMTFRLAGGSRYTPDFITFDGQKITAWEVKGSYRFHSQGRAWTAFRECRARFPFIKFRWMTLKKHGWQERN
jgi:hypothetical protein